MSKSICPHQWLFISKVRPDFHVHHRIFIVYPDAIRNPHPSLTKSFSKFRIDKRPPAHQESSAKQQPIHTECRLPGWYSSCDEFRPPQQDRANRRFLCGEERQVTTRIGVQDRLLANRESWYQLPFAVRLMRGLLGRGLLRKAAPPPGLPSPMQLEHGDSPPTSELLAAGHFHSQHFSSPATRIWIGCPGFASPHYVYVLISSTSVFFPIQFQ